MGFLKCGRMVLVWSRLATACSPLGEAAAVHWTGVRRLERCIGVGLTSWEAQEAYVGNKSLPSRFVSNLNFLDSTAVLDEVFLGWPRTLAAAGSALQLHPRGTADALIEGLLNCCEFIEAEGFRLALGTVPRAREQGLQLFSRNGRWYYSSQAGGCLKVPQLICPCSRDSSLRFYLMIRKKREGFCLLLQPSLRCIACLYPWPLSFCFKVQPKSKGEVS